MGNLNQNGMATLTKTNVLPPSIINQLVEIHLQEIAIAIE